MGKARKLGPAAAHERFERAVEGTPDAAFSEETRIVDQLRSRADSVEVPTATRVRIAAELREQLGFTPDSHTPAKAERPQAARSRFGAALAAVACLFVLCGALGLLVARDAMPGQPLFGLKRGMEHASVGLTGNERAQARKQLDYASTRLGDLRTLRAAGTATPASYRAAFDDFDDEAAAGTRMSVRLGTNGDGTALHTLDGWAHSSRADLLHLRGGLPKPVRARANRSLAMLARIDGRVEALSARLGCSTITSGESDTLGMLPATGRCGDPSPRPGAPPPGSRPSTPPSTPPHSTEVSSKPAAPPSTTQRSEPRPTPDPPAQPNVGTPPRTLPGGVGRPHLPSPPPVPPKPRDIDPNALLGSVTGLLDG